jgi:hypothetical protein
MIVVLFPARKNYILPGFRAKELGPKTRKTRTSDLEGRGVYKVSRLGLSF